VTRIGSAESEGFFQDVDAAARSAVWAAVATVDGDQPRVRMVHPTWEGQTLWFATGTDSPKHKQLEKNAKLDVVFQVSPPDFVHLLARGASEIIGAGEEKKRVWDVIDYDLSQFWPGGPEDPNYTLVKISPVRVELSKTFGMVDKRVWRA
jgi:general stress protein 26